MSDIRHLEVLEALDAISSSEPSSGAGIAAGVALALATACALKAVNISLKHGETAELQAHGVALLQQRDRALDLARADAELYRKYLRDHEPRDAAKLVQTAEAFQQLAREVAQEVDGMADRIIATMAADVTAARLLHTAAVSIEALIIRDSRVLRARTMP